MHVMLQLTCKHFSRAAKKAKQHYTKYLKPWQRVSTWQRAIGKGIDEIDFQSMVDNARHLFDAGCLESLEQPNIVLARKGRPARKADAETEERAKSFLESVGQNREEAEVKRVLAGGRGSAAT